MIRRLFFSALFLADALVRAQTNTTLPNTAQPKPSGDVGALYRLYGWHGCTDEDKKAITDALGEKDTITGIDSSFVINWNGAVAVDHIGFPASWVNNRDQIQANFRSLYTFGNGWWFHSKNTQIFCHDKSLTNGNKDDCSKYPGHIVTVNRYEDDHDAMMFCDSWFALRSLPNALAEGLVSHDPFDISNYENRAIYLTSALCIKQDICRWPRRSDGGPFIHHMTHDFREWGQQYVSTPSAIKWLAKERNPLPAREIVGNADMYGWWAMTGYVMESRQLGHYPARPYVPLELKFPDVEPGSSAASDLEEILKNTIPDVGGLIS